jgi:hypothetical protein
MKKAQIAANPGAAKQLFKARFAATRTPADESPTEREYAIHVSYPRQAISMIGPLIAARARN